MAGLPTSGFRLFRIFGITVYIHWSWFLVAVYELQMRRNDYPSMSWNVAEYLTLFAIVLTHEFGHALACRSVGGEADRIVLWPLGGVAYVNPPRRPGAMLWSIVAGPLVNVVILLFTYRCFDYSADSSLHRYLYAVAMINLVLLIFNILPIYPLDGGKILWALLWFPLGEARSLMAATVVGMIGMVGLIAVALYLQSIWLGILAVFAGINAWSGFKAAQMLRARETVQWREEAACPSCGAHPPVGPYWVCSTCGAKFDAFEHTDSCPGCGKPHVWNTCLNCGGRSPFAHWFGGVAPVQAPPPAQFPLPPIPPAPSGPPNELR